MGSNSIRSAPLPICEINRYSQHTLRFDFEINRIRNDQCPIWNDVVLASRESDSLEGTGLNGCNSCRAIKRKSYSHGRDGQIAESEGVGDADSDRGTTDGHVQRLADCRIHENRSCLVLQRIVRVECLELRRKLTNGAGGRLAGSVSCGMLTQVSTQCLLSCLLWIEPLELPMKTARTAKLKNCENSIMYNQRIRFTAVGKPEVRHPELPRFIYLPVPARNEIPILWKRRGL